jgi:hypothetical protein
MGRRKNRLTAERRRLLAMKYPQDRRVIKDPRLRQVELIGTARSPTKHYIQMASFLQIDLDSPPVWHVSMAMLDQRGGDGGEILGAFNWTSWMADKADELVYQLIPDCDGTGWNGKLYRDINKFSVDYYQRLTPDELTRLDILKAA